MAWHGMGTVTVTVLLPPPQRKQTSVTLHYMYVVINYITGAFCRPPQLNSLGIFAWIGQYVVLYEFGTVSKVASRLASQVVTKINQKKINRVIHSDKTQKQPRQ